MKEKREIESFRRIIRSRTNLLQNADVFEETVRNEFDYNRSIADAIILLYQMEITSDIEKRDSLDDNLYFELWDSLSGNFKVDEYIAKQAVWIWFRVYGEEICGKDNLVSQNDSDESEVYDNGKEEKLIGMRVMNTNTHAIGVIRTVEKGLVTVDFHGEISKYSFPSAFGGILEIEDEDFQNEIHKKGIEASFENFKRIYRSSISQEIEFLKATGGKKYRILDGEKLPTRNGEYLYAFDTDTELHFPDGTAVKLWFPNVIVPGYVVSCEDFTILIRTMEYIGDKVDSVELTSEQWQLLEALMERLGEMTPDSDSIAYEIATSGKSQISNWGRIKSGQNIAFNRATSEKITFIWGPPGTGKTETLANIALEHIDNGRRVLMLSYSNVSVDGALLRVAQKSDLQDGMIIRYGYPRTQALLESKTLTSYQFVLHKYPSIAEEYQELIEKKKKIRRKDPQRQEINKRLNSIREFLLEQEKELIQESSFVATTVSKATVDSAVYTQRFDVVIFDEASMAYVPQIVFSAGLAKDYFVCLGDFCQLPAIVQNRTDDRLASDIFEYTGITSSVYKRQNHEWLVMLDLQYRMHPVISDFVSEQMYQGRLNTSERIIEDREEISKCLPLPGCAMSMIDLSGMYSVCIRTMDGSRINILSAMMSLRLAEKNIKSYEVGIITPYSAQSRLVLAMIRDIQETDEKWSMVTCATVHQFQGSEKPMIIYDAVDCYRMTFPGTLLTSMKNDTANRLFNVAITRTKGKFIMISNVDYLERKHISRKLIFTKTLRKIKEEKHSVFGALVLDEMMPNEGEDPYIYVEDIETSWGRYIEDINQAEDRIQIDMPDLIMEDDVLIRSLIETLILKNAEGVDIRIRVPEEVVLPVELQEYTVTFPYVTNPLTIIDKRIVWYGQPLYAADFISGGDILDTEYFPCLRFAGKHFARLLKAFLEM